MILSRHSGSEVQESEIAIYPRVIAGTWNHCVMGLLSHGNLVKLLTSTILLLSKVVTPLFV